MRRMKFAFLNLFLPVVIAVGLAGPSRAEESVRMVVLQAAAKDLAAIRKELGDVAKGSKPEAIDELIKRRTATALCDFKEANPWRSEPILMQKATGTIKVGGMELQDLGVFAKLEGGKYGAVTADTTEVEIALPAGGDAYRTFQSLGNSMVPLSGRWQERACWSDAKEALTLWQYAKVTAPADPSEKSLVGNWDCARVQMLWFRATNADLQKLAQAKPENRAKAMEWLAGRAKLWTEAGFRARTGERTMWISRRAEPKIKDGDANELIEGLSLDGNYSGQGEELRMEWSAEASYPAKAPVTFKLSSPAAPGVWIFLPVQDLAEANVVACRISRD